MNKQGLILTLSAPSGTGKDSICAELMKLDKNISFFATATTRNKRAGEQHGIDYHFLAEEEFTKNINDGCFLEWVQHHGHRYGTFRHVIESKLNKGLDITSDLSWGGVESLKNEWENRTITFLFMPPSAAELANRLKLRQEKSGECSIKMQERIKKGIEDATHWQEDGYQFTSPDLIGSNAKSYDYVIVNADLNETVKKVHEIIKAERIKRES